MNNFNSLSRTLLAGAVALAITAAATTTRAEEVAQVISIMKVEGQARYSVDNNKTWQPLHKGDVLKPGSIIQTAEKSTVDLVMGEPVDVPGPTPVSPNMPPQATWKLGTASGVVAPESGRKGSIIHIYESTVLAVDKLVVQRTGVDEVSETQLDLRAGQILGNVKKLSAASRYEVKIPNGVAGIRGTTYVVSATGTVYVLSGSVTISFVGTDGQLHVTTVTAGNSFNPFAGGPAGQTSPTPANIETALVNANAAAVAAGAPANTPSSSYTKNGITVQISSN